MAFKTKKKYLVQYKEKGKWTNSYPFWRGKFYHDKEGAERKLHELRVFEDLNSKNSRIKEVRE
jgi:hypothetical protein